MIVGVLKEIKTEENRVSLTPAGVEQLVAQGHQVLVEVTAGKGSGFSDTMYQDAGGELVEKPTEIYERSDMVLHVKEPLTQEYAMVRPGQVVFTYFHFAASRELTQAMIQRRAVCIAYETITDAHGRLPLLTPMSEVAGRMAAQEAAKTLEHSQGGRGILMGGVPGVAPATVMVLGGGTVGTEAARIASGLGAQVYLLDTNLNRLRYLADTMPKNCVPLMSSSPTIRELLPKADAVIGAVLVPGAKAPRLITKDMLSLMRPGAVLVDVAIDQGGCFETSRPTTHTEPVYEVDGIIHYCVANMPGAVPLTSTQALTNATLPYVLKLAENGWQQSAATDAGIAAGVNMVDGNITCPAVAEAFGLTCTPLDSYL
ncbi:alanine dehydrogenase [Desulfobulbus rhabdoformis]|uniref:alanine dehydrogenase n=1 Tax=Desulfobulbus rhabdoformis TaxID=34032 RepID=UPI0019655DA7|nr:alanine dehydrogenase [Desulfobulbus rhabdoformis]MBM9613505.1 alanine dehydrogenase [Desulfobulbus rhabdoformis]